MTDNENENEGNGFAKLGLPASLVRSLETAGFTHPTPIQEKAIPAQLEGRDILGVAQTGSGKTAAFGLPILAALLSREGRREPKSVGALILAPTRELAVQIDDMIRAYAKNGHFSTALVLGGVSRHAQVQKLARGVDIVVATPGRLMDLLDDRKLRLDMTEFLVLDEADRMLDMGFIAPVKKIAGACHRKRQTALFSATMAPEVAKLAESLLNNPVRVEANPQGATVGKIDQSVILCPSKLKRAKLNELLGDESLKRIILFSRTKHGADKIAKGLKLDGHEVGVIHGNKTQNARQNALRGFRAGKVRILVATDIVARGIDVPEITHVINYDLPDDAENYVHRIGRTGRNGASGIAISLVDAGEGGKLRDIERLIRRTLPKSGELPTGFVAEAPTHRGGRSGRGGPSAGRNKGSQGLKSKRTFHNKTRAPNTEGGGDNKDWFPDKAEGEGAADRPRASKGGKQRWNKRKKDASASRAPSSRPPRRGGGAAA